MSIGAAPAGVLRAALLTKIAQPSQTVSCQAALLFGAAVLAPLQFEEGFAKARGIGALRGRVVFALPLLS